MMSGIRGKNTAPELTIRKGLHRLGYRYRLHDRRLAGTPDLVFPSRRAVIFVHGCFWHGHDCHLFKWPASRKRFWKDKIGRNIARDRESVSELLRQNWRVLEVWECALKGRMKRAEAEVLDSVARWLASDSGRESIRGRCDGDDGPWRVAG